MTITITMITMEADNNDNNVNTITITMEAITVEADTRMLAHAKSASAGYSSITIKSPDTDVFIIALNASLSIRADLYFETGRKDKRRIISISKVKENLGDLWSAALIGFHSFTGNTFNFKFAAQLFSK